MISLPMLFGDLLGCHPGREESVPVRKVRLREVGLDAELLMVNIMVGCIVAEEHLQRVKG